jgi:hypothetical protein
LVEVARKAYLASIVPVIVNAILNEHQIVVDIVAFVNKGDFPRSRLGEKQRGKILASWVTRKMRTMAQFGIRDADAALADVNEGIEPRSGLASIRNGAPSIIASSLRNVEPAPQILEQRQLEEQLQHQETFGSGGAIEMPAENYDNNSIQESPPPPDNNFTDMNDDTPTDNQKGHFEFPNQQNSYQATSSNSQPFNTFATNTIGYTTPTFMTATEPPEVPPPRVGPKPPVARPPQISLPAVEGREAGNSWNMPSQQAYRGGGGGLRVHNANQEDEEEWPQEAIMHMNLSGRG